MTCDEGLVEATRTSQCSAADPPGSFWFGPRAYARVMRTLLS